MATKHYKGLMLAGSAAVSALAGSAAYAVDFNITGFVRQEIAVSVTDQENPFNTQTNPFMGLSEKNVNSIGNPAGPQISTGKGFPFDNALASGKVFPSPIATPTSIPNAAYIAANATRLAGAGAACVGTGTCGATAGGLRSDQGINLFATRAEIDIQAQWNEHLKTFVKIRGYSDFSETFSNHIGTPGGHFSADYGFYGKTGNVLEWNTPSFMVDLPAAYVDYNDGPLWVRVGQQQIAWGEAYFFRVFDVPNGLDTRRHFTLDVAAEEFSDKRVAAPGIRTSYTFKNGWELDTFLQMSAPTTIVNTNTAYNVIASGFTWRDTGQSRMLENVNFGARMNLPLTDKLTMGVMAVNRVNPDGVVTWTDAPKTLGDGSPNPFCFGPNNYAAHLLGGKPIGADLNQNGIDDVTELMTPLSNGKCGANASPDPLGTASWQEWFTMAGKSRLNPVEGVLGFLNGGAQNGSGTNASTLTTALFGLAPGGVKEIMNNIGGKTNAKTPFSYAATRNILDAFYNAFAFPRGYITRNFYRETITGVSGNYIFESTPGSWLDQLIVRAELSVTPNKKFTPLDLREGTWIEATEVSSALILEKYHQIVPGLPATYLVLQWMHKTESDLFGRHLSGNDHSFKDDLACLPTATFANNPTGNRGLTIGGNASGGAAGSNTTGCGRPKGQDGADYVSFAFQQPFPNLIWRADFAMLIDTAGGVLFQPGVRFKPNTRWQFDLYANILQNFTPNRNTNVIETLDFADEVFGRVSFFF